jgi:predicted pyridoxine 5'-phosphate oxidase superfamily flavin-nucleotide-binding protein
LTPFHEGERALQERLGERALAERNGAVLARSLDPRAIPFLAQQRMIAIGTADADGHPRASLLFGPEGFVSAPDEHHVVLSFDRVPRSADELWKNLRAHEPLALLAIDLSTRRRYRVNGVIDRASSVTAQVSVREAYPNCPKYIQRRDLFELAPEVATGDERGVVLDEPSRSSIRASDMFFVASGHAERGLDVSHRGGPLGFVEIAGDRLLVPDYAGNGMFNTLGNLAVDPRAGLVFLDLARGVVRQVRGEVAIVFGEGAARHWEVRVLEWRSFSIGVRARFGPAEPSPFLARVPHARIAASE